MQRDRLLREQKSAVEKQANEFKLHQAELNDRIRELERLLDTATKNNSDLRERVAKFSTLLKKNGLSADIAQIKGLESPPPVIGEVKRIDPKNKRLEITIGSDDGLVVGHELFILPHQAPGRVSREGHDHRRRPRPGRGEGRRQHLPGQEDKGGGHCLVYHQAEVLVLPQRRPRDRGQLPGPRGVLVQSPKSDIYVALLGISLGALIVACILMSIIMGRYGFSTKVADASVPIHSSAIA